MKKSYTPEEEARLEKISEEARKIAREKYILPMTRLFLLIVAGILVIFGIILLILNFSRAFVVSIVIFVIAFVLVLLRFTVFRKKLS